MRKDDLLKQAAENREFAARGRNLARLFTDPADQARAQLYFAELEKQADTIEAQAAALD